MKSSRRLIVDPLVFLFSVTLALLGEVQGQPKTAPAAPPRGAPSGTAPAPPTQGTTPGSAPDYRDRDRSGAETIGGPKVDLGYEGFQKDVDVNGDGRLDYCRFVGDAPNILLSCQLGVAKEFWSKNPYGFNSITGIDQGYANMPRALIDVNGDGRPDFCRYVGDPPNVKLSCDLAEASGFAKEQYKDPVDFLGRGDKRALLIASDGTPISYIRNSTTGSWFAFGTDAKGIRWRLEGDIRKTLLEPGHFAYGSDTRLYDDTPARDRRGSPLPENLSPVRPGLRLRISTGWDNVDGVVNFTIRGIAGHSHSGFEYSQSAFTRSVGYRNILLHAFHCDDRTIGALCDSYFTGELHSDAAAIKWNRNEPQAVSQYFPEETNLMGYFQPVVDMQIAETDASLETGVDWFDAKHWYEHSSDDLGRIESAISQDNQNRVDRVRLIKSFGKVFGTLLGGIISRASASAAATAAAAATAGTEVFVPVVGWWVGPLVGVAVGEFFSWIGDNIIDIIRERDADACRKYPHMDGCAPGRKQ